MLETMQTSLEAGVATIGQFEERIQNALTKLMKSVFALLQRTMEWLERFLRGAGEYLKRVARALSQLLFILSKLSLFYLPGLLCWLLELPVVAILWCVMVTAAGLIYRKEETRARHEDAWGRRSKATR